MYFNKLYQNGIAKGLYFKKVNEKIKFYIEKYTKYY